MREKYFCTLEKIIFEKIFAKNISENHVFFKNLRNAKKSAGKSLPASTPFKQSRNIYFWAFLRFWNFEIAGKIFDFRVFSFLKNIFKMQKWCKSLIGLLACWKKVRFCARVLKRMCTQCFFVKIEKWAIPASEPFEVKINYFKLFLAFLKNGALF